MHFPAHAERAVRLRDYFALQLHFADVVAANLVTMDLSRLWAAFPVPTYTARAPMQAFYDLYQVGAQP